MNRFSLSICILFLAFIFFSCSPNPDFAVGSKIQLATFSEKNVTVEIFLERSIDGIYLATTFTPETGWHVYDKDTPRQGVDGLGRPTLLELTRDSKMQALGELLESTEPEPISNAEETLSIYPDGPVTLRLPVDLPNREGWVDDQISITYMACSEFACLPPVEGKIILVRVPGTGKDTQP